MVCENIRRIREASGLTQFELAKKIGCSQSSLSKYETGDLGVDADCLYSIAQALGVPVSEFYEPGADKTSA